MLFCHAFAPNAPRTETRGARHHGPKLERPGIDIGVSLEEWNVFTRRLYIFKQGFVINDQLASAQLPQSASQTFGDQMLKADADIASKLI